MKRTALASAAIVLLVLLSIVSATNAETAPRGDDGVNATLERPDATMTVPRPAGPMRGTTCSPPTATAAATSPCWATSRAATSRRYRRAFELPRSRSRGRQRDREGGVGDEVPDDVGSQRGDGHGLMGVAEGPPKRRYQ